MNDLTPEVLKARLIADKANQRRILEPLIEAYPEWEKYIINGDFRILEESGQKTVTWSNTNIFSPNPKDLDMVLGREFGSFRNEEIKFMAGFISLSIVGQRP
jgi:hypothetical protein